MSNRAAIAWLAGVVFVVGFIAMLIPVHANDVSCGNAFGGNSDASIAQYGQDIGDILSGTNSGTDLEADCADRRSTQRLFAIPLLALGGLAGGFLLLTASRQPTEDQTPRAM